MYAKHWEHSSKENTVPDFMDLIFYWKWNQGSRQTITKEAKLPYNVKGSRKYVTHRVVVQSWDQYTYQMTLIKH